MPRGLWQRWRRDLVVAALASLLTLAVCIPIACAANHDQVMKARHETQRSLLEQANAVLRNFGGGVADQDAEVFEVSTDAISPEVAQGASLLIDKKATAYKAGDIVVYRLDGKNYLGRVVAQDEAESKLTIGRNGEQDREVTRSALLGRCILNTR